MNRRQILVFGLAALAAGPSFASGFEDEIVASLRAQGYVQITLNVTFLGRIKITALKDSYLREIVLNPRTGEILRDLWLTADGRIAANAPQFDDLELRDKPEDSIDPEGSGDDGVDDVSNDGDSANSGSGGGGSDNSGSGGDTSDGSDDGSGDDSSGKDSGGGRD